MTRTYKDEPRWVFEQKEVSKGHFVMHHSCGDNRIKKFYIKENIRLSRIFDKGDILNIRQFEEIVSQYKGFYYIEKEDIVVSVPGPEYNRLFPTKTQKKTVCKVFFKKENKVNNICTPIEYYDFRTKKDTRTNKRAICYPIIDSSSESLIRSWHRCYHNIPERTNTRQSLKKIKEQFNSKVDVDTIEEDMNIYFYKGEKIWAC